MSDESSPAPAVNSAPVDTEQTRPEEATATEVKEDVIVKEPEANGDAEISASAEVATDDAPAEIKEEGKPTDEQTGSEDVAEDKPAITTQEDVEMKDDTRTENAGPKAARSSEVPVETPVSAAKAKGGKRKSTGVPEHKGKKLNKKSSVAKMTHTDAQPGDYFYVRLKGFPLWPAIVCDESMLPSTLIKSRPNSAARPDGTYREGYEDGGIKVKDRQFPVMYLHTNEFGWIPNYDLVDLNPEDVGTLQPKMRKDLAAARTLAAEQHDLDYFKDILAAFLEAREANIAAKEAAKAEKQAKKAADKKDKKSATKAVEDDGHGDLEMADATADLESDGANPTDEPAKTNKRKAADDTPQGSESVKKARIKLNVKPSTNGTSTPKAPKTPKDATPKTAKPKKAKAAPKTAELPVVATPKEPELSAEEKRAKKEKEILFLRHKLQKGLLTRDQEPKETEMKQMSEFIAKLQLYADLEVSIIRATKINKVLKAILKLPHIPREEEFQFKTRSQELLDKWNKSLATDTPSAAASAIANGNAEAKVDTESAQGSSTEATNGIKELLSEAKVDEKVDEKAEDNTVTEKAATPEAKDAPFETEKSLVEATGEPKVTVVEPAPVESSA
ncbi:related to SRP40-suppressor of mutant AC40 of RNA polymerase I and III [Rhynchosporium agropyri]|uniref:Related to SRP40-suppressor of mutant AC40 of RNA polymerase I and III n=1 Tax=Rhynchosporium agropyri TaxID=914238 RepID=A0A1E1JYZ8_9HELO|nr:related to SRP40-suppressor of mutant AC40 of RNA polymerase I and III [Rhynchosporium agropyri]